MLASVATGCGRVSQDAPAADAPSARIVASEDFGRQTLLEARVPPDQTVLRALRGATEVETAYGGGFVAGMLGRDSDLTARRDWRYWVDGVLAERGADQTTLRADQEAWWDFHRWDVIGDPWAVVGQWPAPFAGREVAADPPLAGALADAGATVVDDSPWRARVGADASLERREPAWARADDDPAAAGLGARIDGARALVVDGDGTWSAVPEGAAVVAAVPMSARPADGVLLVVAGVDAASARTAARAVVARPEILRLRVAVVLDAAGNPLRAAGRSEG
jgi:hypothetical protein